MLSAIVRRLLLGLPNIALISVLLFFSVAGLLGNPATLMLGLDATPERIAELEHQFGFDRPLYAQYLGWMAHAVQGDFGRSYATGQRVTDILLPRLLPSLELALLGIIVATSCAVLLSSVTVARRVISPIVSLLSLIGITVPNFMLGITLIYVFSVALGWLPTSGWSSWSSGVGRHFLHLILPVLTLAAYYFASFGLVYRAEYRATARRLYIQVARAKGLSEAGVSFKHILPNSILPVITQVGSSLGQLAAGSLVTETVFSIPGIGTLFTSALMGRDYPVFLAVGMITIISVMVMNLLADLLYVVANPQIRLD
ncbi:MAG: ABC transporter permease [Alphaproteobacteria bacterium]|nr:ABC transporter permease [Alphaproteobacteria bacterium]